MKKKTAFIIICPVFYFQTCVFQGFLPSPFEDRLRQEIHYREGKVRFASETETSEYDSEVPDAMAPDSAPQILQPMKDFRLIEGADATFVCRIIGKPRPKVV